MIVCPGPRTAAARIAAVLACGVLLCFAPDGRPRAASRPDGSITGGGPLIILFAAETRGNLMPCDCPGDPLGGIGRRTAFLGAAAPPDAGLLLRVHAGGFLPGGEVPLRRDGRILRRYVSLLLREINRSAYDAVAVSAAELAFLGDQTEETAPLRSLASHSILYRPTELPVPRRTTLPGSVHVPPDLSSRTWSWNGRTVAVLALDERASDADIESRIAPVRDSADHVIILARADAYTGRRLAERTGADLIVLSNGAHLERPLRWAETWMVGCGRDGRYVGEVELRVAEGTNQLRVDRYALHPMDSEVPEATDLARDARELLRDGNPQWYARITESAVGER